MITFSKFFYLNESFDTVSDFLLNPEHRDKYFWELMKDFEDSGGKKLGSGSYGTVLSHPKWPYVIKIFEKDDHYLRFVRHAYKNTFPAYPKFYGPPQKIVPFYTRRPSSPTLYISRIEKLEMLSDEEFAEINKIRWAVDKYYLYKTKPEVLRAHNPNERDRALVMDELHKKILDIPRNIYNVLIGENLLLDHLKEWDKGGAPDWHKGNIMKRSNGDYVLIDPIWEGYEFNAYRDHDEAVRREAGYYDDEIPDYVPPKDLRGGELPKKKRVKKKPPTPVQAEPDPIDDELPF